MPCPCTGHAKVSCRWQCQESCMACHAHAADGRLHCCALWPQVFCAVGRRAAAPHGRPALPHRPLWRRQLAGHAGGEAHTCMLERHGSTRTPIMQGWRVRMHVYMHTCTRSHLQLLHAGPMHLCILAHGMCAPGTQNQYVSTHAHAHQTGIGPCRLAAVGALTCGAALGLALRRRCVRCLT